LVLYTTNISLFYFDLH